MESGDIASHFGLKLLTKVSVVDVNDCVDTQAAVCDLSSNTHVILVLNDNYLAMSINPLTKSTPPLLS